MNLNHHERHDRVQRREEMLHRTTVNAHEHRDRIKQRQDNHKLEYGSRRLSTADLKELRNAAVTHRPDGGAYVHDPLAQDGAGVTFHQSLRVADEKDDNPDEGIVGREVNPVGQPPAPPLS